MQSSVILFLAICVGVNGLNGLQARLKLRSDAGTFASTLRAVSQLDLSKFDMSRRLSDERMLVAAAKALNTRSPWNAPRFVWSWAWRLQTLFMPLLHAFDKCSTRDTCMNLAVLWWKAIAGDRCAYDLLPSFTRVVISRPLRWLYPRLHHQNVALRTAFLDAMCRRCLDNAKGSITDFGGGRAQVLLTLGAGFDTRSLRMLGERKEKNSSTEMLRCLEVDLPAVCEQKRAILARYQKRKPSAPVPELLAADMNSHRDVKAQLEAALPINGNKDKTKSVAITIVVEAALMYLHEENVLPMLQEVVRHGQQVSNNISIVFSDRIPKAYEGALAAVRITANEKDARNAYNGGTLQPSMTADTNVERLLKHGGDQLDTLNILHEQERLQVAAFLHEVHPQLELKEWLPKPGRARHQGLAVLNI